MDEQFHDVEFIRLDGEAIRVTSLRRDEATGELLLVAVARGSAAARELEKYGSKPVVQVEIPGRLDAKHRMVSFDMRGVGEGERAIYRASFKLRPLADTAHHSIRTLPQHPPSTPTQLDRIEQKLDELLRLMKQ
jgi:hypothetical protein